MLLMLRSRRATPIQDIVDGATTEDRADRRQDYRLRVGASEHLDGKGRARGERNRELGAVVCCGAGVEQKPCVGGLTSLDAFDDLGPFALELTGILDRGGLGGAGSSNLSGSVGLGHRHGRRSRRGSRSRNGLRCRRYRFGRGSRSRGLGRRLGSWNSSAAVPRHATLMRGRSSGGGGRRRSSSSGTRDQRRLLCRRRCSHDSRRRTRLSSSHARRHGAVGNHGLQACYTLGQCLNR